MRRSIAEPKYTKENESLARYAKALSHPTRVLILAYLDKQSCCFTGELVDVLPLAQSTISQHLKELKKAGLIQGELNPPKIRYCINKENWELAKNSFAQFFEHEIQFK